MENYKVAISWVTLLLRTRQAVASNLGVEIDYCELLCSILNSLQVNAGIVPQIRPSRFRQHPLQFVIQYPELLMSLKNYK
jgi:hypothetical protein